MQIQEEKSKNFFTPLLEMSIGFTANNCSLSIRDGDLISFFAHYLPELDIMPFKLAALEYLRANKSYHLREKVRYLISHYYKDNFFDSLANVEFKDGDVVATEFYDDLFDPCSGPNYTFNGFMDHLTTVIPSIIEENAAYIVKPVSFALNNWLFTDDSMSLKLDDDIKVEVGKKSIDIIAQHLLAGYNSLGDKTLEHSKKRTNDYNMMPLETFIIQFPKDIEILRHDNSFEQLCAFMNKYQLGAKI